MTFEQTREQFLLALNSNAYLNMCECSDMQNAIFALEKQTPKSPVVDKAYSQGRYPVGICPNCKKTLGLLSFAKDFEHCYECGQALDWSDTELNLKKKIKFLKTSL